MSNMIRTSTTPENLTNYTYLFNLNKRWYTVCFPLFLLLCLYSKLNILWLQLHIAKQIWDLLDWSFFSNSQQKKRRFIFPNMSRILEATLKIIETPPFPALKDCTHLCNTNLSKVMCHCFLQGSIIGFEIHLS